MSDRREYRRERSRSRERGGHDHRRHDNRERERRHDYNPRSSDVRKNYEGGLISPTRDRSPDIRYTPRDDGRRIRSRSSDRRNEANPSDPPAYTGPKEKASFTVSGALNQEHKKVMMTRNGIELKYSESVDSALPTRKWKLFVFKGEENLDPIDISRNKWYLIGRDRQVADIPSDHASCSKQHAVIQYRKVPIPQEPGDMSAQQFTIKPYLMDLGSTNHTFLNNEEIDPLRYYELLPKDVIKFGESMRTYVLLHDEMVSSR